MPARDEDGKESRHSSLDAVRGRYAQPPMQRWWYLVLAVLWLAWGVTQLVRGDRPYGLVVGVLLGLTAAWVWRVPAAQIGDEGIRLRTKPLIAWSQVSDVAIPVDNGWKLPPAELVLVDGRREPLPMLSRPQSVKLREHALRQSPGGSPGTVEA